ncbi:uncharacterized protein SCHCODRAFT_02634178 [Schizophyllum commune H4-8]|uniref:Pesticidal crystal protein cry6Aa n=1 Tax=Schizophyllum commune (strain H4-8 / FGSC 9210) TaxID=578458 RepID=D8QBU9_SCHCM|nr:uncharacterized protein SCHCODRAFT_02634178 [Schizophyllum commune H4-8]KAI5889325.1 hypothetical protein SCHCODRAFT_02634178 [Schizophyllum commune H4-8]
MAMSMKPGYNVKSDAGSKGPTPQSTGTIDLTPMGLLNDANNYVLQQDSVYNLLKYAWTGVLLPTSVAEYWTRVPVSNDVKDQVSGLLKPLLESYARAKGHCTTFKQTTYPSIVGLASDVYDYAQDAGGKTQDSYYANIVSSIKTLATATSQEQKDNLVETIGSLVDMETQSIDQNIGNAQTAMQKLQEFGRQMKKDELVMRESENAIISKLKDIIGDADELQKKLERCREKLAAEEAELEHDKIVAATSLTYAWIPGVGTITATVVAALYGKEAKKMAERIDDLKKLIASTEEEENNRNRAGATRIIADLTAVDADLRNLHALTIPAAGCIEEVIKTWMTIADALVTLKDMASKDPSAAEAAVAKIDQSQLVEKWNALKVAANKYRQAAFVVEEPPKQTTLEELSKQLHGQAARAN